MSRFLFLSYGFASYALFFVTFLYTLGFLTNIGVPRSIDVGPESSWGVALTINLALLLLFSVQHSVMARPGFKKVWTRIIPEPIERSTYVLISTLCMILLYWAWKPMPAVLWQIESSVIFWTLTGLSLAGAGIILISSFLIDHFDLFGLRQVVLHWRQKKYTHHAFKTPGIYRKIRHPLYLGWITCFWFTPTMTVGHLLFAVVFTGYILVAVVFEERDLVAHFGKVYSDYQARTTKIIPARISPSRRAPIAIAPSTEAA